MRYRSTRFGILYPDPEKGQVPYFPTLICVTGGIGSIRRLGDALLPGLTIVQKGLDIADIEDLRVTVRGDASRSWAQIRTSYDNRASQIVLTDMLNGLEIYLYGAYCTPERQAALRMMGFRQS